MVYDQYLIFILDFWLKEDIIFEQPNVDYRYQTIVQLYGSK